MATNGEKVPIEKLEAPETKIQKVPNTLEAAETAKKSGVDVVEAQKKKLLRMVGIGKSAQEAAESVDKTEVLEKEGSLDKSALDSPEVRLQVKVADYNKRTQELHTSGREISASIAKFQKAYQRFENGKKEWSVFLRGSPLVDDDETEQLKHQLQVLRRSLAQKMHDLRVKQHQIEEEGKNLVEQNKQLREDKEEEKNEHLAGAESAQKEKIEAYYNEILSDLNEVDIAVVENVASNTVANNELINAMDQQVGFLNSIDIERPGVWDASGGLLFNKIGEGSTLLTRELICQSALDPLSRYIKKHTKDIPVVNVMAEVAANVAIDLPSGVIEGAGELVSGVSTMVAHPVEAAKGVAALAGRNPQTGEWSFSQIGDTWGELGKAMMAYENFEKGQWGKGVGKVALNVFLTATGAGAAAKGAQGASLAYTVARAAGAGVVRSTAKAAGTGARIFVGEFSHGVAKLPGEAVSATGKLLRAPGRLFKNMKLGTAERLGKEISEMGDEFSKVSKGLEEFTIGGKKVSELEVFSGKNSSDLSKLSPDDLIKAGIKDSGAIREFLEYKSALAKSERIQGSIQVLSHRSEIIQIAPELEVAFKLNGVRLKKFIDEFNQKHPEGFRDKSFKKIKVSEKGVLVFDANGKLRMFKNEASFRLYKKSADFIASEKVQSEINKVFEGLNGVPDEVIRRLREYTERHALEQHFENPEQYVSHGFDHSLNVKFHMENAVKDNPQIIETMMKKYEISKAESETMMKMMAIYHDFGYPEIGELGKALHGVTGAEIAATDEFLALMKNVISTKGAKFDELMFDFKNGILYHSADKVEIFRDAKVKIAHGEFIVDAENIVHVYHRFSGAARKEKIRIVCTEEIEVKMKAKLTKKGISTDTFEFRRPETGEVTVEGKFRGRAVDFKKKGDQILGIQYQEVTLLDDPMNYMIRLTDNLDMTAERFSEVQRTEAFKEIYRTFGPLEGQKPPTGKLLEALERCKKGKMDIAEVLSDQQFKAILDKLGVDTNADIGSVIKIYKERIIEDIIRNPKYEAEVAKHGDRIKKIGMAQNTESVRHFGGCESVKNVQFSGKNLTVTVDRAKFDELNRTKISELAYKADGTSESVMVGIGEYQIWRTYEASRSLGSVSERLVIRVVDEGGNPIIADFEKYFIPST